MEIIKAKKPMCHFVIEAGVTIKWHNLLGTGSASCQDEITMTGKLIFAFLLGKLFCREIISNQGDQVMHYYHHIPENISQLHAFEVSLHVLKLNNLR